MQKWPEDTFILIPSYKSSELLKEFLPRLLKVVPQKQICIVDDASGDETGPLCDANKLVCLNHNVNRGKGAALDTGFKFLIAKKKAKWIITMDADGQHVPEDLANFLDSVQKNPLLGMSIGCRSMKIGVMPFARICSNKITSFILSVLIGVPVLDSQCGYRIYSSELLKKLKIKYQRFEMESEVIIKAARLGFQIGFTDVQTLYLNSQSHISHLKDTFRWVKAVISVWSKCRQQTPG